VAVLGGGAGGLTAAFELTATPELRERYEVTVYQLGWRLGGKGASGRRRLAGGVQRIEEHGLHIWFGFYENAFDVIRRVYGELERPAGHPLRRWDDAFHPTNEVVLLDDSDGDGTWKPLHFHFPHNDETPGDAGESPGLERLMRDALETLKLVEPPEGAPLLLKAFDAGVDRLLEALEAFLAGEHDRLDLGDVLERFLKLTGTLRFGRREPVVCRMLRLLRNLVWWATRGDRYAMTFDLMFTVFRGILVDRIDTEGFGKVNGEELTAWLARHGAKPRTLECSPILRAFYQLCFAYADGDRNRPNVAAGKALQAMLRMCLGYRGALMWKMQAGMGDAIFAPMYEALRDRGVRFEFFSEVTSLGLSGDGTLVERIGVRRQARTNGEYLPLIDDPGGLASWPAEPLWDQLDGGDVLRAARVDFEAAGSPAGAPVHTLRRGTDFDDVVLGMSIGSLRPACDELAERHPRFANMLAHARTVGTQALQVWLTADRAALGFHPDGMVSGGYVSPLDTLCDMSHLMGREGWAGGDGAVRSVGYFCGTMTERDGETQEEATARALRDGIDHLHANAPALWPGAADGNGGFDWELLHDPDGRSGQDRIMAQYWRANVRGSERYVLTPPGSVEHRLRPDEAGPENLVLAGDWTRNGVCGGSVEAAVTSGKLAARALSGSPAVVPGTEGWLEAD
jgi:uncharacterized protein with NAD-binding domain and iron-sulfur cluster